MTDYYFYPYISLTGGGDGALDSLDGSLLKDKDAAFVVHNGVLRTYSLDADSALAESSPDVIAPDSNAGDKRWIQIYDDRTSADLNFVQSGTGASTRTSQAKLRDIVSVKDFGAVGDGVTDDSTAIQAAFDSIHDAGGSLHFPHGVYVCTALLDFTRGSAVADGLSMEYRYRIFGDAAVLDFSTTSETSGALVTIGATAAANFNESGEYIFEGIRIHGPESGTPNVDDTPDTSVVGLSVEYCYNCTLRDVQVTRCYKGFYTNYSFPIHAANVRAFNCYVGLHVGDDSTRASWTDCTFKNGRFGIVLKPDTATKSVIGQTFIGTDLEGNKVGVWMDPEDGTGIGIRHIDFIDPYLETIARHAFVVGRDINLSDASDDGANRSRNVYGIKWIGGVWEAGGTAWGASGHDAIKGQSTGAGSLLSDLHIINVPVASSVFDLTYNVKNVLMAPGKDVSIGTASPSISALPGQSFCRFDGAGASNNAAAIRFQHGISSVTKTATGDFVVNLRNGMVGNNNYGVVANADGKRLCSISGMNTSGFALKTYDDAGNLADPTSEVNLFVFGME